MVSRPPPSFGPRGGGRVPGGREGGRLHTDRSLDGPRDCNPLLRDPVLVHEVRPDLARPLQDAEELDDERILFQLQEPMSTLGGPTDPSDRRALGSRWLVVG